MLTKRAVEKHINSIFMKLGLAAARTDVNRRVKAALLFLAGRALAEQRDRCPTTHRAPARARASIASSPADRAERGRACS